MNERFTLEHNHATTFTLGHADWYRDCPVCDLGQEIFRDAAKVRYDYDAPGTKWAKVTMPNIEALRAIHEYEGVVRTWYSSPEAARLDGLAARVTE